MLSKSYVSTLRTLLEEVKDRKLLVALAFRLNKTVSTFYGWMKLEDEKKALEKLFEISQIDQSKLDDSPALVSIVGVAKNVVKNVVKDTA